MEEFKPIKDYEHYYISNCGRVLNTKSGKMLNMYDNGHGYLFVRLCKNGEYKTKRVHRLVAQAFIENPDNLDTVDHINGIKTDNRAENLQWLSNSDNVKRFYREQITEEQKQRKINAFRKNQEHSTIKPIICTTTGIIYESVTDASKKLNIDHSTVSKILKGIRYSTHGYHFKYL